MLRDYEDSYLGLDANGRTRNYQDGQLRYIRVSEILKILTPQGIPLRAKEYRINFILEGSVTYNMNLIDYPLKVGDVLITPPNTLGVFSTFPKSFHTDIIILPLYISDIASKSEKRLPTGITCLHLEGKDFERIKLLLDLLEVYVKKDIEHPHPQKRCSDYVNHMLLTIVYDLIELCTEKETPSLWKAQNTETLNQFLTLVNEYGMRERNMRFYADKMNLSISHLSTLILEQSGQPATDWIVQTTITEAKMLLRYSNLMIFEIAAQLRFSEPSAFVRYFRTHTGISPGAYRKKTTEVSEK